MTPQSVAVVSSGISTTVTSSGQVQSSGSLSTGFTLTGMFDFEMPRNGHLTLPKVLLLDNKF